MLGHITYAIALLNQAPYQLPHTRIAMINAVLVFNNNGQPRLTKFYTQLVSQTDTDNRPYPSIDQPLTSMLLS